MDGLPARKGTDMASDRKLPELTIRCPKNHIHAQLQGRNKTGPRTAQTAVYPPNLIQSILGAVENNGLYHSIPNGGSVKVSFRKGECRDPHADPIRTIGILLGELEVVAHRKGMKEAWNLIVVPWIKQHPQISERFAKLPDQAVLQHSELSEN